MPDRPRAAAIELNVAYASVARQLRENGYSPVPLSGKAARIKGWQKIFCERMPSIDEIQADWSSSRRGGLELNGIGVANAGGLLIIDVDDDLAVERVLNQVPQARGAPTCIGNRGCKIFLRSADQTNRQEWNLSGSTTDKALEILAWHKQGVVPPTAHPTSGEPYRWVDDACTLVTIPLNQLPVVTHDEVLALHVAFTVAAPCRTNRKSTPDGCARKPADGQAEETALPPRWWENSPNADRIENLARQFGIVHRAARDAGGKIILQADGNDASGLPHRPEIVDIDNTGHWRTVVRIIVAELGHTEEAYRLHVEVSKGNEILGLPGGPSTYNEVGNRRFYNSVVDPMAFAMRSGKRPRTLRTLPWWVAMIEGRRPASRAPRKRSLVKAWHIAADRLRAGDLQASIRNALLLAEARFAAGSAKLAFVREAVEAVGWYGGGVSITGIKDLAARHGVGVRTLQLAIVEAERAGILIRTRGNEGGKVIHLTVPVSIEPESANLNVGVRYSPSLHSGFLMLSGGQEARTAAAAAEAGLAGDVDGSEADDRDFDVWEDPPSPYGDVGRPTSSEQIEAFDRFVVEARQGKSIEETLLEAGILPPAASQWMLQIVEANVRGKMSGARSLRHIAAEIGELVLREPETWPRKLQSALDYVEPRVERKEGRLTACKWAQTFAQNLGFEHDRAGRSTPMARKAQAARRRWEKKLESANNEVQAGGASDGSSGK
jgi:hypothetical protein